eukprot:scaffold43379_cov16-Tisochrysis_lutea.AAC.1
MSLIVVLFVSVRRGQARDDQAGLSKRRLHVLHACTEQRLPGASCQIVLSGSKPEAPAYEAWPMHGNIGPHSLCSVMRPQPGLLLRITSCHMFFACVGAFVLQTIQE